MDLIDTIREFARRLKLEHDSSAGSTEQDFGGFTARLRFRVSKRLEIPEYEQDVEFGPYKATLLGQNKGQPIRESDWLILRVKGLGTEEEARKVGEKLKVAVALSSARARLGVDIGNDKATGSVANFIVEAIRDEFHVEVRPNVHGLDVYSEVSPVLVLNINADALVSTKPEPFLSGAWRFFNEEWPVTPRLQQAVILLNAALINPEPLAQVVLAVSAVEMMGQDEEMESLPRKQLLKQLADAAGTSDLITAPEGNEVAAAIQRGMHSSIGLRQGVLRVLARIGMLELKKEWDDIYGRRSTIVHALDSMDRHELAELAQRATTLCGRIIFKSLKTEQLAADAWLNEFYPLPDERSAWQPPVHSRPVGRRRRTRAKGGRAAPSLSPWGRGIKKARHGLRVRKRAPAEAVRNVKDGILRVFPASVRNSTRSAGLAGRCSATFAAGGTPKRAFGCRNRTRS